MTLTAILPDRGNDSLTGTTSGLQFGCQPRGNGSNPVRLVQILNLSKNAF